jgi:hypothetical protein
MQSFYDLQVLSEHRFWSTIPECDQPRASCE